ncbi:hypothetical protein LMBIIBHN_00403 [Aeromonas salmonicida]
MENQAVKDSHVVQTSLRRWLEPVLVLAILGSLFGYLGSLMGLSALVNTLFNTAHQYCALHHGDYSAIRGAESATQ